ncbi:MAG: phosphatase PAP2 family protein [Paenibacillaceae bacterium]|nr:phosphatase PAP2 family protein [Paenibacillaceae bacterium]
MRAFWQAMLHVDRRAYAYVQRLRGAPSPFVWFVLTHVGGATATLLATSFVVLVAPPSIARVAIVALLSVVISHIPVAIMKKGFRRLRPYRELSSTRLPTQLLDDHSFPSGHATAICAATMPFVFLHAAHTLWAIPIALIVSLSRIVLGHHYPSDVLVGMCIGTSSAWCTHLWLHS